MSKTTRCRCVHKGGDLVTITPDGEYVCNTCGGRCDPDGRNCGLLAEEVSEDEMERADLIPRDLEARIRRLVIDDLRAAGWTVEPPVVCEHERMMGRGDDVVCYDCGEVRSTTFRDDPPMPPSTALRDRLRGRAPDPPFDRGTYPWIPWIPADDGDDGEIVTLAGPDDLVPGWGCPHEWTHETYGGPKCRLCGVLKWEIDRR